MYVLKLGILYYSIRGTFVRDKRLARVFNSLDDIALQIVDDNIPLVDNLVVKVRND